MEEKNNTGLLQTCGLHPLVGFGAIAIDSMLFGAEAATLGASTFVVSIPVGLILGIASILIQKKSFGDNWGLAIGKGTLVGLLTAIPMALPAPVTLSGGTLGAIELIRRKRIPQASKQIEAKRHSQPNLEEIPEATVLEEDNA